MKSVPSAPAGPWITKPARLHRTTVSGSSPDQFKISLKKKNSIVFICICTVSQGLTVFDQVWRSCTPQRETIAAIPATYYLTNTLVALEMFWTRVMHRWSLCSTSVASHRFHMSVFLPLANTVFAFVMMLRHLYSILGAHVGVNFGLHARILLQNVNVGVK